MLVDSHAHLDDPRFDADRDAVIARAATRLDAIITVGADLETSRNAVALAHRYPGVYAAVGIHPHEAGQADDAALSELERLCGEDKVVAVGEIGLDFYRNLSPVEQQRQAFIKQLELARRVGKPVIIHDRDAHQEVLDIVSRRATGMRGVLHCFSGDRWLAHAALELGFYLSFAGPVTFNNARQLQAVASDVPLERILVETDCPYLAPHPLRGQRNEPAYVALVAEVIAQLKGVTPDRVAESTSANARELFGLPPADAGNRLQA